MAAQCAAHGDGNKSCVQSSVCVPRSMQILFSQQYFAPARGTPRRAIHAAEAHQRQRSFPSRRHVAMFRLLGLAIALPCGDAMATGSRQNVLESLGEVFGGAPVADVPANSAAEEASALVAQLSRLPAPDAPYARSRIDPHPTGDVAACDRDYALECPSGFVGVGAILGGSSKYCAPGSAYGGPCDGDVFDFSTYTVQGKARWSLMCQANWPCIQCERDYSAPCPRGWTKSGGERTCVPGESYAGSCKGAVDFSFYNSEMLSQWSASCGAFWDGAAR